MDVDEKNRRIGRLDIQRIKGSQAESLLLGIKPFLQEMREEYGRQLVTATKANHKPHEMTVYLLVALQDIENYLEQRLREGVVAGRKMEKIAKAGGSE